METINEPQSGSELTHEQTHESQCIKRVYKYNTEEERHNASKASKRQWYHNHRDQQKLKSLKAYYIKQLAKTDLKDETRKKYETKLNELNQLI